MVQQVKDNDWLMVNGQWSMVIRYTSIWFYHHYLGIVVQPGEVQPKVVIVVQPNRALSYTQH